MIGAALAIDMVAVTTAVLTRFAAGGFVDGKWTEGSPSTYSIRIADQPPAPRDLERLPEGERTKEFRSVWTRAVLRTADETAKTSADELTFKGGTWKVVAVFDRAEGGYTKAMVERVHDRQRGI